MSKEDPVVMALQARLVAIEQEIDRLTRFATAENDHARQKQYWGLAGDLQAEARRLRCEFSDLLSRAGKRQCHSPFARWLGALRSHWRSTDERSVAFARHYMADERRGA